MKPPLTALHFLAWLRLQPCTMTFRRGSACNCPLANYAHPYVGETARVQYWDERDHLEPGGALTFYPYRPTWMRPVPLAMSIPLPDWAVLPSPSTKSGRGMTMGCTMQPCHGD